MVGALPPDDPEALRVQIELLRRAGPTERFRLARSLTRTVISLSRAAIRHARPGASDQEVSIAFLEMHHGEDLAVRVLGHLRRKQS